MNVVKPTDLQELLTIKNYQIDFEMLQMLCFLRDQYGIKGSEVYGFQETLITVIKGKMFADLVMQWE